MSDPDEFHLAEEAPDVQPVKIGKPDGTDPKTPTNDQQGQAQRRSETDRYKSLPGRGARNP